MTPSRTTAIAASLAAISLLTAACGSDASPEAETEQPVATASTAPPADEPAETAESDEPSDAAEADDGSVTSEEPVQEDTTEEPTDDETAADETTDDDAASAVGDAASVLSSAVAAADELIATLSDDEVDTLLYDYGDGAIVSSWSNLPACDRNGRAGIRHGDLSDEQVEAVHAVVSAVLSESGALEYRQIIAADEELGGGDGQVWDADCYYLALFGTPSTTGSWALQFGGHHYARTVDFSDGQIAVTPAFTGVEPRSFELDGETIEPLADESDAVFAMLAALSEDELAAAELSGSYSAVELGPGSDAFPASEGLALSDVSDDVRSLALAAIERWTADFAAAVATAIMADVEAGLDQTLIGWSNSIDADIEASYARIDGPSVWIEFVNEGGVGGNDIHQHSVYRDKQLDYGSAA